MSRDVEAPIKARVVTLGSELAVLLPPALLAELGIGEGAAFFARAETDRLVLSLREPREQLQRDAAREGMARYRNTLAELAK